MKLVNTYLSSNQLITPLGYILSPLCEDSATTLGWVPSSLEIQVHIPYLEGHVIAMQYQRESVGDFILSVISKVGFHFDPPTNV